MNDLDYEDEYELDEFEEAMSNCCGHYDRSGVFVCEAVGSEDCEFECPFNRDLGMTAAEAEQRDIDEELAEVKAKAEARGGAEYESWSAALDSGVKNA